MLTTQLVHGLKSFFKEKNLSDRTLRIVEIDEHPVKENTLKRKRSICPSTYQIVTKKRKVSNSSCLSLESERSDGDDDIDDIDDTNIIINIEDDSSSTSSNSTDDLSNGEEEETLLISKQEEEECYSELPVHSIVLCINSVYFQKLFVESGMKEINESTITIKVNKGEGKYLELLIQAFYNQEILETITLPILLSVLDIAARFSCTTFVEQGLQLLDEKKVNTMEECDAILQYVSRVFQIFDGDEKYNSTKLSCVKFLCENLFPLEFRFSKQEKFKQLHHCTVLSLLNSAHAFSINENHSFIFIYQWLKENPEHQTAEVIELFLSAIRYESLTVSFLTDELTVCDTLLSKWCGYASWFSNVLKYHSLSHATRELRSIKSPQIATRTVSSTLNNVLYASKNFSYNKSTKAFMRGVENHFIWNGISVDPILSLKGNGNGETYLRMRLIRYSEFLPQEPIKNFHQRFELYFCLLPGHMKFKLEMMKQKKFIYKQVRKADIEFKSSNISRLHAVAKVDNNFVKVLEEHGVNIILFFKKSAFSWVKFDAHNVKSSKKLINFCGNRNFSQYEV